MSSTAKLFITIAVSTFGAVCLYLAWARPDGATASQQPSPRAAASARPAVDPAELKQQQEEEQERIRFQESIHAEAQVILTRVKEREGKRKQEEAAEAERRQADEVAKEIAAKLAEARAAKAKVDGEKAAVERDRRLRAKSASLTRAPRTIRVPLGDGHLDVEYPHSTLYMLTRTDKIPPGAREDFWTGVPKYHGGGSEIHVFVTYTVRGEVAYGTEDYFRVGGRAHKLSITSSDERVLKNDLSQGFLRPVEPGEVKVTVSLAGVSTSFPVTVVPLDISRDDSAESVITKYGLPDDEEMAIAVWPNSTTLHNLRYYDDLRGNSRTSATHWKFNRFPGAVIATDRRKVIDVSSVSPNYRWPKDESRDRLRLP